MKKCTLIGTGLIGNFYTMALHGQRNRDKIVGVCSRRISKAEEFARQWDIPFYTDDMDEAINHPESEVVIVALPNNLHKEVILKAIDAGKGVLCTKPLAMNGQEALELLQAAEKAGVFHGYLEDLVYTPKTLKSVAAAKEGALGRILWARSREAHPGPHSDWFWDPKQSGGGAIIDLGCHCIEISRNYIGKDIRPVEVMCWLDTQVKPIDAEDHALGWVKYANGAIGQFEVSWNYRGGMDLRDEVSGTEGTLRLDHFLRTGFEMYTSGNQDAYIAEKAESEEGWLFPVGDEVHELGYTNMFTDMFNAMESGKQPTESFYDGYVVNCIMDACYRSAKSGTWEPVELSDWRGRDDVTKDHGYIDFDDEFYLIKKERLPDGKKKVILKHKSTGDLSEKVVE